MESDEKAKKKALPPAKPRKTSKPVKGEEAHRLGLVDAIASPHELVNTARRWALDILERRRPWVASLHRTYTIESLGEAREAPNLDHPIVCIDVIEAGIVSGPRAGLWKEAEESQGIVHTETCKSLTHFFFAQRGTSRVSGITDQGLVPRRINRAAILGGGLMGSEIATTLILGNYPVVLKEVNEKFLQAGMIELEPICEAVLRKGK